MISVSGKNVIIFDFDGVILDSSELKLHAFKQLFTNICNDSVYELNNYLDLNQGVSRFIKFKYIIENFTNQIYDKQTEDKLNLEFKSLLYKHYNDTSFIHGALDFIQKNYKNKHLFIATSSPDEEIKKILKLKMIDKYFIASYGYPISKSEAIEKIIKSYDHLREEIIFFGDQSSDYEASKSSMIDFIGVQKSLTFDSKIAVIRDFTEIILK